MNSCSSTPTQLTPTEEAYLQIGGVMNKFNNDIRNKEMSKPCDRKRDAILLGGSIYIAKLHVLTVSGGSASEIGRLHEHALKDINASVVRFNDSCGKLAVMREGIKESLTSASQKVKESASNIAKKMTPFSKSQEEMPQTQVDWSIIHDFGL